ncbi:Tim44-like domain containing protein [Melia azedarach]|uniref:Tim44-like domain containing protein n=1 Tax=Melia azedarach TaxID=155640 RepID=A0ACC1Y7F2_MELAZ|nr:Tim44-like domain containing protein [Melia azedarach]
MSRKYKNKTGIMDMDQREEQSQSVNPCQRLYNFMMKFLARSAHKMPKEACSSRSSQPVHPMAASGTLPNEDDDQKAKTCSPHQEKDKTDSEEKKREQEEVEEEEEEEEEEEDDDEEEATAHSQPKAPKKMVSINDNVETITSSSKKRKKKSKRKKKKEQEILDDIDSKPLKSILKVTSDLNNNVSETPPSILSRADGA